MLGHFWKVIPFLVVGMTDQGRTQGRRGGPGCPGARVLLPVMAQCPHIHVDGRGVRAGRALQGEQQRYVHSGLTPWFPGASPPHGCSWGTAPPARGVGWGREGSCSAPSRSLPSCKHLQGLVPPRETSRNAEGRCQVKQFHISVLIALSPLVSEKTPLWVLGHFHAPCSLRPNSFFF